MNTKIDWLKIPRPSISMCKAMIVTLPSGWGPVSSKVDNSTNGIYPVRNITVKEEKIPWAP